MPQLLATSYKMDPPPSLEATAQPAEKSTSPTFSEPYVAIMLGAVMLLAIIWVVLVVMLNKVRAQFRAMGGADGVGQYEHKAVMVQVVPMNPDATLGGVNEALEKEGREGWRLCTAHTIKRTHFDPQSQKPVDVPLMVLWLARRRLSSGTGGTS